MSRSSTARPKLDFHEKLLQSGKKETTEALLKRIKTLHQKLRAFEQEGDQDSVKPVSKALISPIILHHKDRGVRAYAACCLADVLRVCAPDAPFTADQLRDIFQFFVVQIGTNLKVPSQAVRPLQPTRTKSNVESQTQTQLSQMGSQQATQASQRVTEVPYYTEYCYLLDSLANIESVVLACDAPGGDDIVASFFQTFLQIIRSDMAKNVVKNMTHILVLLINDSGAIPSGVMDCIIGQFTDHHSVVDSPSFSMMVEVCNTTAERLARPVYAHVSEIQLSHGRNPSTDDLEVLAASHKLLLNMFRFSPGLLLNVVPLLEANLKAADEIPLRQLSTRTLGRMFGERPVVGTGRADLARAYPSAWRAWLGRKVDKSLNVRLSWVESTRGILCNHPELRNELEKELIDRIHDSDEKVRAAICKVIGGLDYETALNHIGEETLKAVGGRMSDKKASQSPSLRDEKLTPQASVRSEAASALGKLWSLAYGQIESNEPEVIAQFAWIPEMMLLSLLKRDVTIELRTQIAHIFKTVILPLPSQKDIDERAWVDRLLLVSSQLNEQAFGALKRLTGLAGYHRGGSPHQAFVDFCEANNGGVIDQDEEKVKARLAFVITALAQLQFADVEKAKKDMNAFAAINDQTLYRLYRQCVDIQSDLRTLVKARAGLLRRIEQSHTDILETFTTMLDMGSWNLVNHSSIPPLIATLQKPPKGPHGEIVTQAARELLRLIAKEGAPMFKSHVPELVIIMGDKKNAMLSEAGLQALAAVTKWDKTAESTESRVLQKAQRMAIEGTPKQAKYAARVLAYSKNADATCSDLVDDLVDALSVESELLVSHLSALSELALSAPESFGNKSEEIIEFVTTKVINAACTSAEDDEDDDEWVEESTLPLLDQAKLVALRICTHRALGFARAENKVDLVKPVLNLLISVINQNGQVTDETNEGSRTRMHMRYRASTCLLKLAQVKAYDKALSPNFENIAILLMDPCEEVRHKFLLKLGEVLPSQRLLPRWNMLPAFSALDPEAEDIALAKSIMQTNVRACRHLTTENQIERIEMPLARLILQISNIGGSKWDLEGMKQSAKYIELYLECVANKDNVSLLYHIAGKIKTVRSVEHESTPSQPDTEPNRNLYALSELTQLIIKNKAARHNWSLSTYPGKISLPRDIFHNLTDPQAVQKVVTHRYLPDDIAGHVSSLGRRQVGPSTVPKRAERTSPVKRSRPAGSKPRKKSRKQVDDDDEDDEDEEDEEEEDEEDDAEEEAESAAAEDDVDMAGEVVVGRGGRRSAKTRAKKAVAKKPKKKRVSTEADEESDLTDLDDE